MTYRTTTIVAAVLALSACDNEVDERPMRPGELGAGNFVYACVGDADPLCTDGFVAETFPERVAVGARFGLDYNPDDSLFGDDPPTLRIEAPNVAVVRRDLDAFFIQQAGYQVFLAVTNDSEVVDLQHVLASNIDRIAVRTADSEDLETIEMSPGERLTVFAVPQDANRSSLGGSLRYTWSVEDESVASVATVDEDFDVTVVALEPGTTTLSVETSDFVQQVAVDVLDLDDDETDEGAGE